MVTEAEHKDADRLISWLVDRIAHELRVAPETIGLDEAFFNIGLNSLQTLIISQELSEFVGDKELSPSLFWDYPTIHKLAAHLAELPAVSARA